jgi:putative two-component system response regulator
VTVDACVPDLLRNLFAHDEPTHAHCRSVGAWSGLLAKALKLDAADVKLAVLAGTLHDIGKALTPAGILRKPGPLSAPEWDVMRRHAGDGAAMLAKIPALRSCAPIVRSHHEDFDGRGYPDGLSGERIPLVARIVAVSDSFHAMISSRPYRSAATVANALDELRSGRGSQWDRTAVDAMVALVAAKTQRANPSLEKSNRAS